MKKLIIMDNSKLEVHVYEVGEGDNDHYEDIIITFGFKLQEVSWMITDCFKLYIH